MFAFIGVKKIYILFSLFESVILTILSEWYIPEKTKISWVKHNNMMKWWMEFTIYTILVTYPLI